MIERFTVEYLVEAADDFDVLGYMERRVPGAAQHLRTGSTVAMLFRKSTGGPVYETVIKGTASAEMRDEIDELTDA